MKAAIDTQKELERISGNIHLNHTYLVAILNKLWISLSLTQ